MEIKYKDKSITNTDELTEQNSVETYIFPSMKIGFQLNRMHFRTAKSTWNYPTHEHPLYEINLVTKGRQIFSINGKKHVLDEGDFVIIRPGDVHSSTGTGNGEDFSYFCVHFNIDDKLLLPYFNESTEVYFPASSTMARSIRPLLDRLMEFSRVPKMNLHAKMNMNAIMFELLGNIVANLEEQQQETEKISERTRLVAYKIAQEIDLHMQTPDNFEDFQECLRIEEVAKKLDFSVSYCTKVFKKVFQMSPRQYVTFRKINEAKSLLTNKNYSIEQIAILMGYHDPSHFSRQFKRWTGISPGQYRQNQAFVKVEA